VTPWDTDGVKAELEKRGLNPRPDMVGADFLGGRFGGHDDQARGGGREGDHAAA